MMKQGDVDPKTGLVYWSKQASCRNGQRWITPEQFARKKAGIAAYHAAGRYRERQKKHRNTDAERAKRNAYAKVWRKTEARRKKSAEYARIRRATNPVACAADRVRARIREVFRKKRISERSTTSHLLGCTWEELVKHIESLFKPGMNWNNRGEWHIDHIRPLACATTEAEVFALCHYTNLQPLWAKDNRRKGALDKAVYLRRAIEELDKQADDHK